ncbi:unnamed protein product [Amoebophrya sp. A120]|nr:unnamed protein product [Amoebophrya sp. A120]|eukprot:GSA120T00023047001.1
MCGGNSTLKDQDNNITGDEDRKVEQTNRKHQMLQTRLQKFRELLHRRQLTAYLIPHNDAHFSEYLCARDERLAYISGFDGSAGCAVITAKEALLWTDGRYWQQASTQLGPGWTLMRQGDSSVLTTKEWLLQQKSCAGGLRLGMDPWLVSVRNAGKWEADLGRGALSIVEATGGLEHRKEGPASRSFGGKQSCAAPASPSLRSPRSFVRQLLADTSAALRGGDAATVEHGARIPDEPSSSPALGDEDGIAGNLVDKVRMMLAADDGGVPPRPAQPILDHSVRFAGEAREDKLLKLRGSALFRDAQADGILVCALDEIAWLLNLRGTDIPYNPVFFAFLLVLREELNRKPILYCDRKHLELLKTTHPHEAPELAGVAGEEDRRERDLEQRSLDAIQLKPYENLAADLRAIAAGPRWRIVADEGTCPAALRDYVFYSADAVSPIPLWKAKKNDVELAGMQACHIRDGVAKTKFLMWLEDQFVSPTPTTGPSGQPAEAAKTSCPQEGGLFPVTEVSAAATLEEFRKQESPGAFRGLSFPTISGSGPNGAIVHYNPKGSVPLQSDTLYLVDSGAQYSDGTTDVTRTVLVQRRADGDIIAAGDGGERGQSLGELRLHYTLVLKGHISIATAAFPENTPGAALDILARLPLWKHGLNYQHGTGHGVGSFLNVHEGPHGIPMLRTTIVKTAPQYLETGLQPNMVLSNEPGYYLPGKYGIRIENLVYVRSVAAAGPPSAEVEGTKPARQRAPPAPAAGGERFCCLENLTFIPLDRRLIDVSLLTHEEVQYINDYHEEVYAKLAPFFAQKPSHTTVDGRTVSAATQASGSFSRERLREMTAPLPQLDVVKTSESSCPMGTDVAKSTKRRKVST